jgi:CRP-like cAMP-binding protein
MQEGAGFGELALIYNHKRSATIVAAEDCELFVLDGVLFKQIVIKSTIQKRSNHSGFLNQIKLFATLD